MMNFAVTLRIGLVVLISQFYTSTWAAEPGPLVIIGGGGTPTAARRAFVELAGGENAIIAVIPHASRRAERGEGSVEAFRELGVANVHNLQLDDRMAALALIQESTGIWFPGGSQSRLMNELEDAELVDEIRLRHLAGAVLGGTSAGAAVMSRVMITGGQDPKGLVSGATPIGKGLSAAPAVIIDQHFIARDRVTRLMSAVLDHPQLVGIGIDESTGIVLHGGQFRVIGESQVVVIDARDAEMEDQQLGKRQSGRDLRLHILKSGESFSLEEELP